MHTAGVIAPRYCLSSLLLDLVSRAWQQRLACSLVSFVSGRQRVNASFWIWISLGRRRNIHPAIVPSLYTTPSSPQGVFSDGLDALRVSLLLTAPMMNLDPAPPRLGSLLPLQGRLSVACATTDRQLNSKHTSPSSPSDRRPQCRHTHTRTRTHARFPDSSPWFNCNHVSSIPPTPFRCAGSSSRNLLRRRERRAERRCCCCCCWRWWWCLGWWNERRKAERLGPCRRRRPPFPAKNLPPSSRDADRTELPSLSGNRAGGRRGPNSIAHQRKKEKKGSRGFSLDPMRGYV